MGLRILPAAAGLLVAALVIAGGVALIFDDDRATSERASIDAIVRAPQAWEGRSVLVSGRIVAVDARAFAVGTPAAELLVVLGDDHGAQPFGLDDIGARVRVRGEIERVEEQGEIASGRGDGPRAGDALLRARALQRLAERG